MKGYFSGMIQVELTGADTTRTLSFVNDHQIAVYRLASAGDLTVSFWVLRSDYRKLAALCEKRGDKLKILRKRGLHWAGINLFRRPVLLAGGLILVFMSFYLPSRVLFVQVDGNNRIPSRQIIAAAESCGVGFGSSRRYVRSEKVKNALLGAIPELQWAGVNTNGCTAVISVRERAATEEAAIARPMSIAADRDGYILSADVTRGTALISPGQTVRKGQTLISGYTDCGICIRVTGAEGEIFAQTRRNLSVVTPSEWHHPGPTGVVGRKYSLLIRKKRINLWKDSGICDATCGRMYREFYVTLPGGYRLPAALCVDEYVGYAPQPFTQDQGAVEPALRQFAEGYLHQQMVSGEILHRNQQVSRMGGLYRLAGDYDCTEMIGRVQQEQIGETNGKRD